MGMVMTSKGVATHERASSEVRAQKMRVKGTCMCVCLADAWASCEDYAFNLWEWLVRGFGSGVTESHEISSSS